MRITFVPRTVVICCFVTIYCVFEIKIKTTTKKSLQGDNLLVCLSPCHIPSFPQSYLYHLIISCCHIISVHYLQTQFGKDLCKLIAAQLAFQKYHCNSVNSAAYTPNVTRKPSGQNFKIQW